MTTRFVCLFLLIFINFLCFKHVGVVNIQIILNLRSNSVCLARISGRGNNASTLVLECLLQFGKTKLWHCLQMPPESKTL